MIFIESDDRWTRDDAWAVARTYAEACRANPHLRAYGVIAKRIRLAGNNGQRSVWGVFACLLADAGRSR